MRTPPHAVLWGKCDSLRLVYDPTRRMTVLIGRAGNRLLGEARGHPTDSEVHDQLGALLAREGVDESVRRDFELFRVLTTWRPAA